MARKNYFEMNQEKFGENWIVALKPDQIQNAGKRIVSEMVNGQIDYQKYGMYFLDGKFLDNLIIKCSNELEINTLYYRAVSYYNQSFPNIPNVTIHVNHLQCLCYIYNTILNKLNMVKQYHDIGYLADTSAMLYSYRNHLN